MKVSVIIVAAGSGLRFQSAVPKPFVILKKKPIIHYSLAVVENIAAVDEVVIVGHNDFLTRFKRLAIHFKKIKAVVPGGETRAKSVQCGLKAVNAQCTHVLVHDAARPLIDAALLDRVMAGLKRHQAVIAAVPLKPTIKLVDRKSLMVKATLNRDLLWEVQTPQGFDKKVLLKAHARSFNGEATDDAMLVEHAGIKVKVVMGDYRNIKITTPEDLTIAKALL